MSDPTKNDGTITTTTESRSISVTDKTPIKLPLKIFIGLLGTTIALTAAVTAYRVTAANESAVVAGHETRIQRLETSVAEFALLKNDVSWIRREMENEKRARERTRDPE